MRLPACRIAVKCGIPNRRDSAVRPRKSLCLCIHAAAEADGSIVQYLLFGCAFTVVKVDEIIRFTLQNRLCAVGRIDINPQVLLGDTDGDGSITVSDALLAMRAAIGAINLDAAAALRADMDGNGSVSAADALAILRLALGL